MPASRHRTFRGLLLLFALTFAAYVPVAWAGYVWDDDDLVTHNLNIRSLPGLWTTWFDPTNNGRFYPDYYPLTFTTWALEYRLWGLRPLGYHLDNVLLHGINAVLAWIILRRLRVPGAFLAAAIFAAHPVHVESVAWVSERKNVLSGLLYLLTTWTFLAAFDPAPALASPPTAASPVSPLPRRRFAALLALSLALFALAMLSKPVSMTLAGVLPLLLWWRRGRLTWRGIAPALPYLLLTLPMILLTTWFQRRHVAMVGEELSFTFVERTLIAGRVLAFYVGKFLWPASLSFAYPSWRIDAGAWWQWLFPLGAAGLLAGLWLARRRVGLGPLVAMLFFCVTLSPALGFIDILWHRYYFVADHVQYLASLGLAALVAAIAVRIVNPAAENGPLGAGSAAPIDAPVPDLIAIASARLAAAALVGLLAMLAFSQATAYENRMTLWSDVLAKDPRSWIAMINLGAEHATNGEDERARELFRAALAVNPAAYEAHYNSGALLGREGRTDEAVAEYEAALALKPRLPAAHNALGKVHLSRGEHERAERQFRLALEGNPNMADAHFHLGLLLAQTHRGDEALKEFDLALRFDPARVEAHVAAASELSVRGQANTAIARLREALAIRQDYPQALNNLAVLVGEQGRAQEAIELQRRALRIRPDYMLSRTNLAMMLESIGQPDEAIFHLREAARLRPDDPGVAEALRSALARRFGTPATAASGPATMP
ncbi:MAG: tetratricopeptide repeat protein [Planctomycetota bacterium]|nr:tetratricopeptide repeat protein [Planctomycetota bacterium]